MKPKKKFAFVSRHKPTPEQIEMARELNIEIDHVGDHDAFDVDPADYSDFDGAIVVHPAAALRLIRKGFDVGVFSNANRAKPGEPPKFKCNGLYLFRMSACGEYVRCPVSIIDGDAE